MSPVQADQPWWPGAVIYQLYVRSWRDSDDDGYGDLRGIIARLDYLSWLGVDGIWLSPTMSSPSWLASRRISRRRPERCC